MVFVLPTRWTATQNFHFKSTISSFSKYLTFGLKAEVVLTSKDIIFWIQTVTVRGRTGLTVI